MQDAFGRVTGIRLRAPNGRKWSVPGGKEGLFVPSGLPSGGRLLVTEGPTDTAALLDLGFTAVGRPSCSGGRHHVVELAQRLQAVEVVVVADRDVPGMAGANALADVLVAFAASVRVIAPPQGVKDARAWLNAGATAGEVEAAIEAAPVRRLVVTTEKKGRRHDARARQTR